MCQQLHPPHLIVDNVQNKYLKLFLTEFKKFVETKFEKTDYQKDIFNTKLTLKDDDISKSISFNENAEVDVVFTFDVVPMEKILTGKLNWECCYVGYESTVNVNGDHNISSLIRWLSMFGYVYQQRILPSIKEEIS